MTRSIILLSVMLIGPVLAAEHPWELVIGPIPTRADVTPRSLRTYTTIHSIGVEWDLEGDADHDAACTVQYRRKGTAPWKKALPLFRVDYAWWYHEEHANTRVNMLAGSILFLEPGSEYEVELSLSDPDGGTADKTLTLTTRPVPKYPTAGNTHHVVPGAGGGRGSAEDPFRGIEAAEARAEPGDIFLLQEGDYGDVMFRRSGEPGRYVVWKAAGDAQVLFSAIAVAGNHTWFEGFTLKRHERSNGFRTEGGPIDIVVRRNRFDGFHYSIQLSKESSAWYIADNVIVGDNDPDLKGHESMSGEGIELSHSDDHTVCHNRISRVADGISYPGRNCDLFGNDIFDVSDDGLEPDYGWANNRMWGNRIYNYQHSALSFQPMYSGPWYFIRNQVIGNDGLFKFRVQDRFLLAHNTFVCWNGIGDRMHHILTSLSRNNLYISAGGDQPIWSAYACNQPKYCLPNVYEPHWMTDVDYDGFDWGSVENAFHWNREHYPDLESFTEAVGIGTHSVRVQKEDTFEQYDVPTEPSQVSPQVLTLKRNAPAIDAGDVLPNINDDFVGEAPDLGAHERGNPLSPYGPRTTDHGP